VRLCPRQCRRLDRNPLPRQRIADASPVRKQEYAAGVQENGFERHDNILMDDRRPAAIRDVLRTTITMNTMNH
jgi:hypothetical protein